MRGVNISRYVIRWVTIGRHWELRRLSPDGGSGIIVRTFSSRANALAFWSILVERLIQAGLTAILAVYAVDGTLTAETRHAPEPAMR